MRITTTVDGTPTFISVWGGGLLIIPGTIPGIMGDGTVQVTTVACMIPGFTGTVAGTVGTAPGLTAGGTHPGITAVGMIPGTMVTAATMEVATTTVSMTVITVV